MTTCETCGNEVPERPHCIVCGSRLGAGSSGRLRRAYAAVPEESVLDLGVMSTLLPRLSREELSRFRLMLVGAVLLVASIGALGYYPVALAVAVFSLPWLLLVYLRSVDVWESEPLPVLLFTLGWGAAAGAITGLVIGTAFANPISLSSLAQLDSIVRVFIVPVVVGAAMVAGPLLLLRWRRFNDVLDGATFGATAGAAFVGAQFVAQSLDLFTAGLQPGGDLFGWVLRILLHAVVLPLTAAGAAGGLCAALWLRYRAPVDDRTKLGWLGRPIAAAIVFGLLMIGSTAALLLLRDWARFLVELVLAALALLWLRLVVHLGLLEEATELLDASPVRCPNCQRETPPGRFCAECGMSLRAVAKRERANLLTTNAAASPSTEARK